LIRRGTGPRALLAAARPRPRATRRWRFGLLAPVAADPDGALDALLADARRSLSYCRALARAERPDEALAAAELAETIPSVDIRSQVRSRLRWRSA
jgi:hypothetical protein